MERIRSTDRRCPVYFGRPTEVKWARDGEPTKVGRRVKGSDEERGRGEGSDERDAMGVDGRSGQRKEGGEGEAKGGDERDAMEVDGWSAAGEEGAVSGKNSKRAGRERRR
jgi:hypothetical protein